jgi:hypothetical protein
VAAGGVGSVEAAPAPPKHHRDSHQRSQGQGQQYRIYEQKVNADIAFAAAQYANLHQIFVDTVANPQRPGRKQQVAVRKLEAGRDQQTEQHGKQRKSDQRQQTAPIERARRRFPCVYSFLRTNAQE